MTFAPGDRVHIARLGTGVVREVRNGNRYLIELKGKTMTVEGAQMERAEPAGTPRSTRKQTAAIASTGDSTASEGPTNEVAPSLDLHGHTVEEAMDALATFLNDALIVSRREVRVIHGRSGGRIRAAIHKRLRELPPVRSFRVDPRNPGVTIVTFS